MDNDDEDDDEELEDIMNEETYRFQGFKTDFQNNDDDDDDVYTILMEQTEDQILLKIRLVDEGQGLLGFAKVHQWIKWATASKVQDKQAALVKPDAPKDEKDLVEFIENSKEDLKKVGRMIGQGSHE